LQNKHERCHAGNCSSDEVNLIFCMFIFLKTDLYINDYVQL
jgi:hypothetical protein